MLGNDTALYIYPPVTDTTTCYRKEGAYAIFGALLKIPLIADISPMKKYIKEPFSALSHLVGVGLSVAALIVLLEKSGHNERATIASAIYGVSLILLYIASALTHGVHCSDRLASYFERCDHAAIFSLIAGTYTPVCLLTIKGPVGLFLLGAEWILAIAGIYTAFVKIRGSRTLQVLTYLCMGWLFLFALGPLVSTVPVSLLAWLFAGVLFYSLGSIFFLTNRPILWKGRFESHDLWHLFVLGGSVCHFIFIMSYMGTMTQPS